MSFLRRFDHTEQVIAALRIGMGAVCTSTALAIVGDYADNAPVDTGFMRSSGYVVTHDESTYGQGTEAEGPMLPEIPRAEKVTEAWAAIAAEYAAYVEYGTRYMPARPTFYAAFDKGRGHFETEARKLERLMRSHGEGLTGEEGGV